MSYRIEDVVTLMRCLRDKDFGCPWDQQQTFETIAPYTVEETYEVIDAIDRGDMPNLQEELGDLLFQVIFHSQMAQEQQAFNFDDVVNGLMQKMLRRHPHVFPQGNLQSFGQAQTTSTEEVNRQWQAIKAEEKRQQTPSPQSLLTAVSVSLPPLTQASQLQKQAAKVGFDWPDVRPVLAKIREELDEFEAALHSQEQRHQQQELGDILFAMANLARHVHIDPERALQFTNQKFRRRFQFIEAQLQAQGKDFDQCDLEELDRYWDMAKQQGG